MSGPHNQHPSQEAQVDSASAAPSSLQSLGRRRTLLAGIGRAGALAGAAVPLSSLATGSKPGMRLQKTGKYYVCTVSGQNSVVHSAQATNPVDCGGKGVAWYQQKVSGKYVNWPVSLGNSVCPISGSNYVASTATFQAAFGCTISRKSTLTLSAIIDSNPTSDEAHWIVATLNATQMSGNFPFTTGEVKAMCQDAAKRGAAFSFFTGYLEQG